MPCHDCVPRHVGAPEDALHVILTAHDVARPGVVALLLDEHRDGLTVVVVDGAPEGTISEVCDLLLNAVRWSEVGAMVLASVRPGRSHLPTEDDRVRWPSLVHACDDAGVDLLDWFVLAGGHATSLAEHTGASRW